MRSYQIVDEPRGSRWENLIVDPQAILLISILLPLVWRPPLFGHVWMPLLWVAANGIMLGSPTLRREIGIIIGGLLLYVAILFAIGYAGRSSLAGERIYPYGRILLQAVFFLTLYLVVFTQSAPHAIHQYVKEQASR